MKLPETKSDRIKLLIVVLLATLLVLLGIVQGIIIPLRRGSSDRMARLRQCDSELESARRIIKFAPRDKADNTEVLQKLRTISQTHMLQPVLGNYALSANGIIEDHLKANSLEAESISEIGITELPQPDGKAPPNAIKCYTARIALQCGYAQIIDLLKDIESGNPYVCIVGVQIASRTDRDPENHSVTIDVQWPIWGDPKMPEMIETELQENAKIRIL